MARYALARSIAALVLLIVACPASLFGSVALGCGFVGYTGRCAMDSALLSPVILAAAGLIAGILMRGWTGLAIVLGGVVLGMFALLFVSEAMGHPVPIDPIQATIATIWFITPTALGYGIGRAAMRVVGWATSPEDAPATEPQPSEARSG